MKKLLLLVMAVVLVGCAGLEKARLGENNRDKLSSLSIGMDRSRVLGEMGKPWKTEAYAKGGSTYFVLYYVTSHIPDGKTTDEEMTPLIFKDNKLQGWGNRFFSGLRIRLNLTQ